MKTVTGETHDLWATPVLTRRVPAEPGYNDRLKDLILRHQSDPGGTMIGVVDGDKTRSDLLRWPEPEIELLREWVLDGAEAMNGHTRSGVSSTGRQVPMVAEAWGVVYQEWGFHHMHNHHDSAWSGVLYVDTGNLAPGSGNIEFLDPRPGANVHRAGEVLLPVAPEPGLMLMFPSWLQHWVTPYVGDSVRICVAFNIGFER